MPRTAIKTERLEARVTREQKSDLERAADIHGLTVTDFVVTTSHRAATETIRETEVLSLRDREREVFVNALLYPPAPTAAMREAARRYRARVSR
jgi:uncharacterized protein (DUF1778 family)